MALDSSGQRPGSAQGDTQSIDLEKKSTELESPDLEHGSKSGPKEASPMAEGPDPDAPPDGGLEAWLVVAGGAATVFSSFGWINCIGIFQAYYEDHQLSSYSSSTIAWIPSTEAFMLFFCGLFAGKLSDSLGPRWPLLLGSFLHVFGVFMISICHQYYQFFLAQSVCSAIGTSLIFYSTIAAAGTWFRRHRALAFGFITAGSSLGGVVLPIMITHTIREVGFGWSIRITAFVFLALLIFGNLTVKSRLPPSRKPFDIKDYLTPFKEWTFVLATIGAFFIYVGSFLPFNFIVSQGQAAGMSTDLANYLIPILNATSTFGRILPAWIGDIYGVFNVCIVFTFFSGIISLALWVPSSSNAAIIVFAALYGFSSGLILSIFPAMVARISDPRQLGVRVGTLYAVSSFGVLFGSPIGGAISSAQHGGFTGLEIFCGVTILVGGVFVTFARTAQVGPGLREIF